MTGIIFWACPGMWIRELKYFKTNDTLGEDRYELFHNPLIILDETVVKYFITHDFPGKWITQLKYLITHGTPHEDDYEMLHDRLISCEPMIFLERTAVNVSKSIDDILEKNCELYF